MSKQTTFYRFSCQTRPPFEKEHLFPCRRPPPFAGAFVSQLTTFSIFLFRSFSKILWTVKLGRKILIFSSQDAGSFALSCQNRPPFKTFCVKTDHLYADSLCQNRPPFTNFRVKAGHLLHFQMLLPVDNFSYPGEMLVSDAATFCKIRISFSVRSDHLFASRPFPFRVKSFPLFRAPMISAKPWRARDAYVLLSLFCRFSTMFKLKKI